MDVPSSASATTPLVILLHGTSGNINDMSDPAESPGFNYEKFAPGHIVDRGWHLYPNVGFWSIGPDQLIEVTGWAPFLTGLGFPVLNYGQTGPRDLLVAPLRELRAILDAIDTDPEFAPVSGRPIVLLGHSRGGILARMVLVEMAASGASLLSRINTCITLHTPNQGSTLANTALSLVPLFSSWKVTGIPLVPPELQPVALAALQGVIDTVVHEVGAPAYADFAVGSPTLLMLAAGEPVPGVTYFTFGGTRPVLLNLRGWMFTPESTFLLPPYPAVPLVHGLRAVAAGASSRSFAVSRDPRGRRRPDELGVHPVALLAPPGQLPQPRRGAVARGDPDRGGIDPDRRTAPKCPHRDERARRRRGSRPRDRRPRGHRPDGGALDVEPVTSAGDGGCGPAAFRPTARRGPRAAAARPSTERQTVPPRAGRRAAVG